MAIDQAVFASGVLKIVRRLNLGGSGDPFASRLFYDLLKKLPTMECHPDLTLSLQTNGLLLTPEMLDKVRAAGRPVSRLLVSVDAANATTYARTRGGDWNFLMKNLIHLCQVGMQVQLNFAVQELNFEEIPAFVELACVLGAKGVYFSTLENWGTYTPDDYARRAVHVPTHPRHSELVKVLSSSNLHERKDIRIDLTNLKLLRGIS
jgi:MoaA/NifB/PqqE/SkfB family radical SAM enzyme